MMHFSKLVKTAALTSLVGLGFVAAATAPAKADRVYTRCDRDGDRCWRVVCERDGDDCRRFDIRSGYDRWRSDPDPDHSWYNRGYYDSGYRRWVCDGYGEHCFWSYRR